MMRILKVFIHETSWLEAKEYFAEHHIAVLPMVSNEEHGPMNLLRTDHSIAKEVANWSDMLTWLRRLELGI